MDRIVPISEARASLGELLDEADDHEVYILRHGKPVGVLLSVAAYQKTLDVIEDLEDEVSVLRAGDSVPFVPSSEPVVV